jgi:hypothetical protein
MLERGGRIMRTLVAVGIAVALAAAGLLGGPGSAGAQRGARVGQPAPEVTGGPWINSEPLSMDTLRGRVVFVEFWTYG